MNSHARVARFLVGGRFASLVTALSFASIAVAEDDAPLRYGWKEGRTLTYSVTVTADRGDYSDVLHGKPSYTVKSADGDSIDVSFNGMLTATRKVKPGKRIFFRGPNRFSPFSPFTGVSGSRSRGGNKFSMNARGEIISSQGSSQLPFLLGNLSQLMIDRLPEANEKTWKREREISISQSSNRRIPLPGFLRQRNQKTTKANEVTTFTIDKVTADTIIIQKKFELKTPLTVGGKPKFHIVGEGELTFDRKIGAFSKLEFQQTITVRDGNDVRETPIQVSYRLLSEEEQKKLLAEAKAARAKAAAPPTAEERIEILGDLKATGSPKLLLRLQQLQRKSPDAADEEMAGALEIYLVSENKTQRYMAAKALENWATDKSIAALIKALDDDFNIVAGSAMQTLAKLRAKEAAEPIAAKLAEQQNRLSASKALKAMGPMAEEPVIKQLENKEWQVRLEACKILGTIGTEKCIKPLQGLGDDKNVLVKQTAKRMIDKVEKRTNAPQT